jgi:hypothetical protein
MTTVVFTCWRCGAVYRAAQHRRTDRYYGVFNCIACHTQVYAWNGPMIFWTGRWDFQLRVVPPRQRHANVPMVKTSSICATTRTLVPKKKHNPFVKYRARPRRARSQPPTCDQRPIQIPITMIASSGTRITSTSVASQSGIRFARCSAMASSAIRMLPRKPVSRYELTHTRPLFGEAGVPPSCAKAPRPCRPLHQGTVAHSAQSPQRAEPSLSAARYLYRAARLADRTRGPGTACADRT